MRQPSEWVYGQIRRRESLRLEAYPDPGPAGMTIPTIGWGHTRGVRIGDKCSVGQADQWLVEDVGEAARIVEQYFPGVTQHQFDALVDFCYNVGPGEPMKKDGLVWLKNGRHSTLMNKTLAGDKEGAAEEFVKWNKSGGVVMPGLTERRKEEAEWFVMPDSVPGVGSET